MFSHSNASAKCVIASVGSRQGCVHDLDHLVMRLLRRQPIDHAAALAIDEQDEAGAIGMLRLHVIEAERSGEQFRLRLRLLVGEVERDGAAIPDAPARATALCSVDIA